MVWPPHCLSIWICDFSGMPMPMYPITPFVVKYFCGVYNIIIILVTSTTLQTGTTVTTIDYNANTKGPDVAVSIASNRQFISNGCHDVSWSQLQLSSNLFNCSQYISDMFYFCLHPPPPPPSQHYVDIGVDILDSLIQINVYFSSFSLFPNPILTPQGVARGVSVNSKKLTPFTMVLTRVNYSLWQYFLW